MQLAHAGDDRLAGLLVGGDAERRILFGELLQREAHLVLLGLGLGLDGDVDDRVGEFHGLEDDRMVGIAEGVARRGVLEADGGDDVARGAVRAIDAVVRVHLEDAADALALALGGVQRVGTGLEGAGIHAEVRELADERVSHDLEGERGERLFEVARTGLLFVGVGIRARDGRDVGRGGQVVHDAVEQLLDALVLVGGTHEDRVQGAVDGALADGGLELVDRDGFVHEDLLHHRVVAVGGGFEELLMANLGLFGEFGRDGVHRLGIGHALVVGLEVPGGHRHEVDDAPEVVFGAHRHLHGDGRRAQTLVHRVDGMEEVGADAVVLVDVRDAGHAVAVGLAPDGLGLGLDAGDRVEDGDGAVEHAQGALDFGGEVDVARGVDDLDAVLDAVLLPEGGRGRGRDGHAALLLLDHPVHRGRALVDLADLMGLARVIENTLGRGGLTGIDVGHDADIARILQKVFLVCHELRPLETIVRERTVGLGHLVEILATLHGSAGVLGGIDDLLREALGHGVLLALAGEVDDPTNGERGRATGVDLHRDLIGCAADALGFDLKGGADVVHGLLEDGQGILAGLLGDDVERTIDDVLGDGLLAVEENLIDQLRDQTVVEPCVRLDFTTGCCCTTRHSVAPSCSVRASGRPSAH